MPRTGSFRDVRRSPDILRIVERAHVSTSVADPVHAGSFIELHSFDRWAKLVADALSSPRDLKTLKEWGRYVGVSTGGLRNWCRAARLSARQSLLFMRLLRVVVRPRQHHYCAEDMLDIVDRRTFAKVVAAGGGLDGKLPSTVDELLSRQRCITSPTAIARVRELLRSL